MTLTTSSSGRAPPTGGLPGSRGRHVGEDHGKLALGAMEQIERIADLLGHHRAGPPSQGGCHGALVSRLSLDPGHDQRGAGGLQ